VQNAESGPRAFQAATKAILQISRINLTAVGTAIAAQSHEELIERVDELEKRFERTRGR
jgi:hypothetical protein